MFHILLFHRPQQGSYSVKEGNSDVQIQPVLHKSALAAALIPW